MTDKDKTQVVKIKDKLRKEILKSMKRRGLSQGEVGRMIGMARNNVNRVLRGTEKRVSIDRLVSMANGIGIKIALVIKDVKGTKEK